MKLLNYPILPIVDALPGAGTKGRLLCLSTNNHVYHDNGSSWDDITAQGSGVDVDELYRDLQFAQINRFVKFTYTDGDLTKKEIFEDNTETVKLFNVDYVYVNGDLDNIEVTRLSDSASHTKTFNYTGGNLVSIDIQ